MSELQRRLAENQRRWGMEVSESVDRLPASRYTHDREVRYDLVAWGVEQA